MENIMNEIEMKKNSPEWTVPLKQTINFAWPYLLITSYICTSIIYLCWFITQYTN